MYVLQICGYMQRKLKYKIKLILEYTVLFSDYGNSDKVGSGEILLELSAIPSGEPKDFNLLPNASLNAEEDVSFEICKTENSLGEQSALEVSANDQAATSRRPTVEHAVTTDQCTTSRRPTEEQAVTTDQSTTWLRPSKEQAVTANQSAASADRSTDEQAAGNDEKSILQSYVVTEPSTAEPVSYTTSKLANEETLFAGLQVYAKWREDDGDEAWYRAEVLSVNEDSVHVLFTDYGNNDYVPRSNVVLTIEEVPSGDEIDVDDIEIESGGPLVIEDIPDSKLPPGDVIDTLKSCPAEEEDTEPSSTNPLSDKLDTEDKLIAGLQVYAKWREDENDVEAWYRAEVLSVNEDSVHVLFIEYGNDDNVSRSNVVLTIEEVPSGDEIDVDDIEIESGGPLVIEEIPDSKVPSGDAIDNLESFTAEEVDREPSSAKPLSDKLDTEDKLYVGLEVYAKWREDENYVEAWYRAEVLSVNEDSVHVLFIGYGNDDHVSRSNVVLTIEEVPSGDEIDVDDIEIETGGPVVVEEIPDSTVIAKKDGAVLYLAEAGVLDEDTTVVHTHSPYIAQTLPKSHSEAAKTAETVLVGDQPSDEPAHMVGLPSDAAGNVQRATEGQARSDTLKNDGEGLTTDVLLSSEDKAKLDGDYVILEPGTNVIAKWSEDGVWYRSIILDQR